MKLSKGTVFGTEARFPVPLNCILQLTLWQQCLDNPLGGLYRGREALTGYETTNYWQKSTHWVSLVVILVSVTFGVVASCQSPDRGGTVGIS